MLILHHLETSRSTRILWLLEELGVEYALVRHARTAGHRAPDDLKAVHPLGKAPVLVDGGLVLAESSTILRYLDTTYGGGRFSPPAGSAAHAVHDEWLDYVEGSAGLPIMLALLGRMTGGLPDGLAAFAGPELDKTLRYVADGIGEGPYLMGADLTLADIQMSYLLEAARRIGALVDYPVILAYLDRLNAQPGLVRAIEKGGPMSAG